MSLRADGGQSQTSITGSQFPLQQSVPTMQAALVTLQHAPPTHDCDARQDPHDTVPPQLFVAGPHVDPVQAMPLSTQHWFTPASSAPQGVVVPHVLGHCSVCPQLSVVGPQAIVAHAVASDSGTQQALPTQRPAAQEPHVTVWPQLLVFMTPPHAVPHVVARESGSQQVPLAQTAVPDAQFGVPPEPQKTVCPQLFVPEPQTWPAQVVATGCGTQPHEPEVQVRPPSHPPQLTCCRQSFVDEPHRLAHQFGSAAQQVLFVRHTPPSPQVEGQVIVCPQLFITCTPHFPTPGPCCPVCSRYRSPGRCRSSTRSWCFRRCRT